MRPLHKPNDTTNHSQPHPMLAARVIPCLDVDRGRVVKGTNFVKLRDAGDPVEVAKRYEAEGADELVFLDIGASHEGRDIIADVVRQVAEQCFMPFTVGGGIRTIDDVTRLIQAGAEKVSINTAAVTTPDIVTRTARRFGRCATVVNIDPKRVPRDAYLEHVEHLKHLWHIRADDGACPLSYVAEAVRHPAVEEGTVAGVQDPGETVTRDFDDPGHGRPPPAPHG